VIWVTVYALGSATPIFLHVIPVDLTAKALAAGLVWTIVAGLAGAHLNQEKSTPEGVKASAARASVLLGAVASTTHSVLEVWPLRRDGRSKRQIFCSLTAPHGSACYSRDALNQARTYLLNQSMVRCQARSAAALL
jgi:hypothetical protein